MFRSLLPPLKTAFEDVQSPSPSTSTPGESPEDFAHDVRVEIIRRTVEDLKVAPNISAQIEVGALVTHENLLLCLTTK